MRHVLIHWLVLAIGLLVAAKILPGVQIDSWPTLAVMAIVLGLVNALIRPVLVILTLPVTVLTLGLFYFVVNGAVFALAAFVVPGVQVAGLGSAMLAAIVVSLVSWFFGASQRQREE